MSAHRPVRNNYFSGRLLTAEDLNVEQEYHRERRRLHGRFVHGCGVVGGLEVSVEGTGSGSMVHVGPGVAIDCRGDEIVVCERIAHPIPTGRGVPILVLRSAEREIDPAPYPPLDGVGDTTSDISSRIVMLRVEEGWELGYEPDDPLRGHRREVGRWTACGEGHGIGLARLRLVRSRWKLDARFRRHMAR